MATSSGTMKVFAISGKELGSIELKDGKLQSANPLLQQMVDQWKENGRTVEAFLKKWERHTNGGLIMSELK